MGRIYKELIEVFEEMFKDWREGGREVIRLLMRIITSGDH